MRMRILGVETSCDETGIALLEAGGDLRAPRFRVLKNLVASQIKIHRPFGGVVPNLAKREHLRNLPILWKQISREALSAKRSAKRSGDSRFAIRAMPNIDLIAVTVGPGLEPALWAGINFAQTLAKCQGSGVRGQEIKLVGANHLEGHLYSFLLPQKNAKRQALSAKRLFPAVALIVSGGHTILLKMESFAKWRKLGETRDDAAGEAFDKVARMLDLPYPGGPEIEKLARKGNPAVIDFPRPMLRDKSYDFSFSGLKTSVLYYIRQIANRPVSPTRGEAGKSQIDMPFALSAKLAADIAASFQSAAIDVLVAKTMRAAREFKAKSIMLSGGVAANKALRKRLALSAKRLAIKFFVPDFKYNLDNAAMIAAAGYMAHLRKKHYKLEAQGGLDI